MRIIKFFLLPALFIIFWLLVSTALVYDPISLSVVSRYHDESVIQDFSTEKILKGNKITGEIRAAEDNFGIVTIRFTPSEPVRFKESDTLTFRIREKGSSKWIAQNSYNSGQINILPFFPFGFPKIESSKGKIFEFQIESTKGNSKNAISLSPVKPTVESRYQFARSYIFSDTESFKNFTFIKISNFLANKNSIFLSFPFLLPLIFYLVYLFYIFLAKKLGFTNSSLLYVALLFMFADVLIYYYAIPFAGDIFLVFFWILGALKYKIKSSVSLFISLVFIFISILALVLKNELLVQKASDWAYYLLLIGIIKLGWEIRSKENNLVSLPNFLDVKN